MGFQDRVVIASAVRTPIGKFGGALAETKSAQLGSIVISEAIRRAGIEPKDVDEVFMGCVLQAGLGQNPARQAAMGASIPQEVPAATINVVCGSGLRSVQLGAQSILSGERDVAVAGGMESMSLAPYLLEKARFGYRMNDGRVRDSMVIDALWDIYGDYHMGITAENIAERFGITREAQDAFAALSQQKCEAARKAGRFDDEIVPVPVKTRKGEIIVNVDEFPRDGVTAESLSRLRPAFKSDGTVTAGNASGVNDGAAAVVLMRASKAKELGIEPLAEYIGGTSVGVDPAYMGLGAAEAAKRIMRICGETPASLGLIEANEAFASQSIACAQIGGWDSEEIMKKVNVNGGALALGHPVGASGCRILVTLINELRRRGGGSGLATLCVGGGMGVASIIRT
jgi:acetyl-CoA C-acetyltransferase